MTNSELSKTALYDQHLTSGGKLVPFHGWSMPLHYGSQVAEHHQVRQHCGVFDVSHMLVCDIAGQTAHEFLNRVLTNDLAKLSGTGQAQYTLMLNEQGGIIDDLIVYRMAAGYRLILNSGCADKDVAWLEQQAADADASIQSRRDLSMLALQGPEVFECVQQWLGSELADQVAQLKPFTMIEHESMMVARTGYTGEHGVEIMLPNALAVEVWQKLLALGVAPCGLGARDTLRLEAGLNLYGQDMTLANHPFESNLGWVVAMNKGDFIGRSALESKAQQSESALVGLLYSDKGVLRSGFEVLADGESIGSITSGSYSPTLEKSVALARVKAPLEAGVKYEVLMRGKPKPIELVKPGFVRFGKAVLKPYFAQ